MKIIPKKERFVTQTNLNMLKLKAFCVTYVYISKNKIDKY